MINVDDRLIKETLPEIGVDAFAVLVVISSHLNVKRRAWPGILRLRNLTKLSEKRTYKAIKKLVDSGLVERYQENSDGVFGKVVYRVTTECLRIYVPASDLELVEDDNRLVDLADAVKPRSGNAPHLSINKKEDIVGLDPTVYATIVDYLNAKIGSGYKSTTKSTRQHINARLREGFTVDDFKAVIDDRTRRWANDNDMRQYLRPNTLFAGKFESYLQAVTVDGARRTDIEQADTPTEYDEAYNKYLEWVQTQCPTLAAEVRYLSKKQYAIYRERKYLPNLSTMGVEYERRIFLQAHTNLERDDTAKQKHVNAWAFHTHLMSQAITRANTI